MLSAVSTGTLMASTMTEMARVLQTGACSPLGTLRAYYLNRALAAGFFGDWIFVRVPPHIAGSRSIQVQV